MRRVLRVLGTVTVGLLLGLSVRAERRSVPLTPEESGTVCMDKYEASVWSAQYADGLIAKIQKGTVKLTDLISLKAVAAGVTQLGLVVGDLAAAGCPDTGNGCRDFYAVSIAEVTPAAFVTWFQAAAAARNSAKRLPTNQEWQVDRR